MTEHPANKWYPLPWVVVYLYLKSKLSQFLQEEYISTEQFLLCLNLYVDVISVQLFYIQPSILIFL